MRDRGSHAPSGSIGDIASKPINRIKGRCEKCSAPLPRANKKFCSPCYDIRLRENAERNRIKQILRSMGSAP